MKCRRFLSGLLLGFGCFLAFTGLLAAIVRAVDNPQLQLVLASFATESPHPVVNGINRFFSLALEQSWQMLCLGLMIAVSGTCLTLHFSPSRPHGQPDRPKPAPAPAAAQPPGENPFAVERPLEAQESRQPPQLTALLHAQPILERNPIGREAESPIVSPVSPSSRFAREARAVEATVGSPSQSGSRIILRAPQTPSAPDTRPAGEADNACSDL